jgi:hypothetical protein
LLALLFAIGVLSAMLFYPPAVLAVVVLILPPFALSLWRTKCPHCGKRLVSNGGSSIEWKKTGPLIWQPSRCRNCGQQI